MIEVRTFDRLVILRGGEEIGDLTSQKARALGAYLAVEGGLHSRAALAAMFWPESDQEHSAASLRVALSKLRKALGSNLVSSRESIGVHPNAQISVDAHKFEDAITRGDIEAALEIYRGDFLGQCNIDESVEYEDWRQLNAAHFQRKLQELLRRAIHESMRAGDTTRCLELCDHLRKLDPYDEGACRQLIISLALKGQRTEAIFQYRAFRDLLQKELGVEPSEQLQCLYRQIQTGDGISDFSVIHEKSNLPLEVTSFVGRISELTQIMELIDNPQIRLISLLGPGGVGKTRLALKAGEGCMHKFPDGVFFVRLDSDVSAANMIAAIANALSFSIDSLASRLAERNQLTDFLRNKSMLLILDGFEHLTGVSGVIGTILEEVKGLAILVTTRVRLGLEAEHVFAVGGLPIAESPEQMQAGGALDLFIDRAGQAQANVQLSDTELDHAHKICQLVEGMPLGIELAASWVPVLSCEQIALELQRNLDFLSSPDLKKPGKHTSMRAVFNQTWSLLTEEERNAFSSLAVFVGGFDHRAAKKIVGVNLEQLSSLIGKSLIRKDPSGRFNFHSLLRQYALERLNSDPKRSRLISRRHSEYYVDFLSRREHELMGPEMLSVREAVRDELANILAAMDWTLKHGSRDSALAAIDGLFSFCAVENWHEGSKLFQQIADAHKDENKAIYHSLRMHQCFFESNLGNGEISDAHCEKSLPWLSSADLPHELSLCLHNVGLNACFQGEYERSIRYLQEAVELGGVKRSIAWRSYYLWLGYVYFMIGKHEHGMESLEECYRLFGEIDSLWGQAFALTKMGLAADGLKQYEDAMQYHQRAVTIFQSTGDDAGRGYALSRMSLGAYLMGDYDQAFELGMMGYEAFSEIGHRWGKCASLIRLGFAEIGRDHHQEAMGKLCEALALARKDELTPLVLNSLLGIACVLAQRDELQQGFELYQLVENHPITPTIYLDMAERWMPAAADKHVYRRSTVEQDELHAAATSILHRFGKVETLRN